METKKQNAMKNLIQNYDKYLNKYKKYYGHLNSVMTFQEWIENEEKVVGYDLNLNNYDDEMNFVENG